MGLAAGTRLGPYEILSPLGAGGMGEVYRARDTKLDRDVAIKVLPEAFAADPDRIARFQREARTLASLNHPNIAIIHGLEQAGDVHALVMELVEGDDLSQRIARGPIPLDEALPIARQMCEALEAAHELGIIHRDLKPANIKVTPDGVVKVLDFGLAKLTEASTGTGGSPAALSMSPTLSLHATMSGVILGTAAYMSPEQARGKTVDKRADIWAFGAVLYEMLTGRRAFDDEDVSMTLSKVLQREPDFDALPPTVPARVSQALRVCLRKDPKQRAGDIRDVRLALEGAFETTVPGTAAPAPAIQPRPLWRRALPVVAAAVVASALVGAAAWMLKPTPPSPVTRFALALGEGQQIQLVSNQGLAFSPDGTQLVYVVNNQLYLRVHVGPRRIIRQQGPISPVFSPDGRSIAFFSWTG
jgi:serine/threonine protein kinase